MTILDAIEWIKANPKTTWTVPLWHTEQMIGSRAGRNFTIKDATAPSLGLTRLGCGGYEAGKYHWVGYDFDVGEGHGSAPYADSQSAIKDAIAMASRSALPACVATSSGGRGAHAFLLTGDVNLTTKQELISFNNFLLDGPLHPDKAPLTAQRFFLWTRGVANANKCLYMSEGYAECLKK